MSKFRLHPSVRSGVRARVRTAVSLADGNGGGSEGARCSPLRSGSDTSDVSVSLALGTAVVGKRARCSPLRSGSGTTTVSPVDGNRGDSKRWVGTYVATWNPLLRSVARDSAHTSYPLQGSGSGFENKNPSVRSGARARARPAVSLALGMTVMAASARCSPLRSGSDTSAVSLEVGTAGVAATASCSPLRSGSDTSVDSLALATAAVVGKRVLCSPMRSGSDSTTVSLVDGNRGESNSWVGIQVATWNPSLHSVARDRARTCLDPAIMFGIQAGSLCAFWRSC